MKKVEKLLEDSTFFRLFTKLAEAEIDCFAVDYDELTKKEIAHLKSIKATIKYCISGECKNCGEYFQIKEKGKCGFCEKEIAQSDVEKKIEPSILNKLLLKLLVKKYPKFEFMIDSEFPPNSKLLEDSKKKKPIIHISTKISIKKPYVVDKLNLNHAYIAWKYVPKLVNDKELVTNIKNRIDEEKNNQIKRL